jgi:hypothetical protein
MLQPQLTVGTYATQHFQPLRQVRISVPFITADDAGTAGSLDHDISQGFWEHGLEVPLPKIAF